MHLKQHRAEIVVGVHIGRFQGEGEAVLGDGFRELAGTGEVVAEVQMDLFHLGMRLDGDLEDLGGLVVHFLASKGQGKIIAGIGGPGKHFPDFKILLDGFLGAADGFEVAGEFAVEGGIIRVPLDAGLVFRDGFRQASLIARFGAEQEVNSSSCCG